MTELLSWIWVAQVVVIIAAVSACLLAIMWVMRRGGPTWHHVIIHEAAKSWEVEGAAMGPPATGGGRTLCG